MHTLAIATMNNIMMIRCGLTMRHACMLTAVHKMDCSIDVILLHIPVGLGHAALAAALRGKRGRASSNISSTEAIGRQCTCSPFPLTFMYRF